MTLDRTSPPLVLVNAVGLTRRWLEHAPRLKQLAAAGWHRRLQEVVPAVTSTAQATILTGRSPQEHGIVANGWLFRDTMEIRFWQQSNRLLQAEPIYTTLRKRFADAGRLFCCAKLFWWFNQGADVDISVTPKPHYGADGNKVFGVTGYPIGMPEEFEARLGPFPFHTFWGPMAGLPCTQWIARCAAEVLKNDRPDLSLVYLPHLDYDPQRHGPTNVAMMTKRVRELDDAMEPLLETAKAIGTRVWIVSEYGHCHVDEPIYLNRVLRKGRLLDVRTGPFGETLDVYTSSAFAVCDHQLAHVYVNRSDDIARVADLLRGEQGIAKVFVGSERGAIGLDHPRSGEIVVLSEPNRWFAYPYWLDDESAPDFARTVDIHRKCGFDPCEMFFDPKLTWPKGRAMLRLIQKKLGFRTLFDVIPLDARIVRGSHGLPAANPLDQPILIGDGSPPSDAEELPMTAVHAQLLSAFD